MSDDFDELFNPARVVPEGETVDQRYATVYPGLEFWFRCEDRMVGEGYTDQCGEYVWTGSHVEVVMWRHQVYRRTPKGAWVNKYVGPVNVNAPFAEVHEQLKFVRLSAAKRYALPTKDEAWESFLARKSHQKAYIEASLLRVNAALAFPREKVQEN